ncbi:MAG TPA: YihY/virulence factor BrkB family protein [candidate division Zixibacteria bacterium]|nr:YihY/virulence factor BrkB family protein [candidate division Zixibacteria bacterium]
MIERLRRGGRAIDGWLQRHRWTRIGRRAALGFLRHEALQNAGAMAYFSVLSLFQLLVLGVVVLSFFVGQGEARDFVIERLVEATPLDPATIGEVIDAIIESRGGVTAIGLVFLVWGALGIFSAVSKGINAAFISAEPRPFVQDKLLGLLLMTITGLLALASVLIGIVTGILQNAAAEVLDRIPYGGLAVTAIGFLAPLLLIFAAFLALYRLVPNRPVTLAEVWPGALVATLLWTLLRIGFTSYATDVANYDSAFGPISAAVSLIVFLYFASVVVLLGAEVARASVVDDEVLSGALAVDGTPRPSRPPVPVPVAGPRVPSGRRLPGWSLALGGLATGVLLRFLRRRR